MKTFALFIRSDPVPLDVVIVCVNKESYCVQRKLVKSREILNLVQGHQIIRLASMTFRSVGYECSHQLEKFSEARNLIVD